MSISVVVPAFNSERTIEAAIQSILSQTNRPSEVLVVDDGSLDGTESVLRSFGSSITFLRGPHKGAASARNIGCNKSHGDVIAFLDADDVWHPRYLETQGKIFREHPGVVACFTGHVDFTTQNYAWALPELNTDLICSQVLSPLEFVSRYNCAAGPFASMSYCCVSRSALEKLGPEPFCSNGAEDTYLFHALALLGPIAYTPALLAAYRIGPTSLSSNRVRVLTALVDAFERLEQTYEKSAGADLLAEFKEAFASKRREYGKVLMGSGRVPAARMQFSRSLSHAKSTSSILKSISWLLASYMPSQLQPSWPSVHRQISHQSSL